MPLLSAIVFAATISAASADLPLVGKWESEGRSGEIGNILEFGADGSLVETIASMTDSKYAVTGQQLKSWYQNPKTLKVEETSVRIRFDDDTLVQEGAEGDSKDVLILKRVQRGEKDDPPIVGTWSYPRDTGVLAFVTFTRDGREFFRLLMSTERGLWRATASSLTATLPPGKPVSYQYKLDKDLLTLTNESGEEFKYRRAVTFK